jgi:hypothetical protein
MGRSLMPLPPKYGRTGAGFPQSDPTHRLILDLASGPMQTRLVTGLRTSDGANSLEGQFVSFELASAGNTIAQTIQPAVVRAPIDASGRFSVELWCNAEGLAPTRYRCRYPDGELVDVFVPWGVGAIDLATINAIASVPQAPSTQQILADLLQQHNHRNDAHPELQAQTAAMMREGREIVERLAKLLEVLREKNQSWSNP